MEFDGWKVDRVSGEISRGDRAARLPQQPLRILIELFDHAGAVVTRDQLVKALWPAGIVDFDNGLNVAMRKLRVALDDVGDTPRYIETLPRVGYRFVGKPGDIGRERALGRDSASAARPHCPRPGARCARRWRGAVLVAVVRARYVAAHSQRTRAGVVPRRPAAALAPRHRHHQSSRSKSSRQHCRKIPTIPKPGRRMERRSPSPSSGRRLTPAEGIPKARAAAARAIELAPGEPPRLRPAGPDPHGP